MVLVSRAGLITREIQSALYDEAYRPVAVTCTDHWRDGKKRERLHTYSVRWAPSLIAASHTKRTEELWPGTTFSDPGQLTPEELATVQHLQLRAHEQTEVVWAHWPDSEMEAAALVQRYGSSHRPAHCGLRGTNPRSHEHR